MRSYRDRYIDISFIGVVKYFIFNILCYNKIIMRNSVWFSQCLIKNVLIAYLFRFYYIFLIICLAIYIYMLKT